MLLNSMQNQIITKIQLFIANSNNHSFKFDKCEFIKYEKGLFKFLSFEKNLQLKTHITFNPYNGNITAAFEDSKELNWSIGFISQLE